MALNNFWQRTIAGAVYVALAVGSVLYDLRLFALLFAVITALGLNEFYRHTIDANPALRFIGVISGTVLYAVIAMVGLDKVAAIPASTGWFLLIPYFLLILGLFDPGIDYFRNLGMILLGLVYVAIPLALINLLSNYGDPQGFSLVLGVLIFFWVNDTGAYLTGRSIGRKLLFPRISPKKTVEGLLGGIVLTLGTAWIISLYSRFALQHWLAIALIVSVFGTLGDLVESMFKRQLGIKDSGNLIPGHGGILDRFDGFSVALPMVLAYLIAMAG